MSHDFVLYHYWRSSCSWRVRWALAHKGLKYKSHPINLLKGEHQGADFLRINPSGMVPALTYKNQTFTESLAIVEWLDEKFPQAPLLPTDPTMRLRARQLSLMIVSGTQPMQNLKVLKYISDDQAKRSDFAKYWIEAGLKNFEQMLTRENLGGTYCLGGQVTMADLCLVPQIYNALRFNVDLSLFPKSAQIYANCIRLPHCHAAAPEQQTDAVR